jgi:hypothetical protein
MRYPKYILDQANMDSDEKWRIAAEVPVEFEFQKMKMDWEEFHAARSRSRSTQKPYKPCSGEVLI